MMMGTCHRYVLQDNRSVGKKQSVHHAFMVFGNYEYFMDWIEYYACAPGALRSTDARVNLIIQVVPGVSSPRRRGKEVLRSCLVIEPIMLRNP